MVAGGDRVKGDASEIPGFPISHTRRLLFQVGHYYNMPIYKTIPDDYHLDPNVSDYFAHTSDEDYRYIWLYPSVNFHGVNLNI